MAESMDLALEKAKAEFPHSGNSANVATWWAKWYLQAGHKRLGRFLVEWSQVVQTREK